MQGIQQALVHWDRTTFLALNHGLKCRALDAVVLWVTNLGLGWLEAIAVVGLAMLLTPRVRPTTWRTLTAHPRQALYTSRWWAGPLLLAIVVSGLAADAVKLIPRDRPWWFYENEHKAGRHLDVTVYTVPGIYPLKVRGFPSGHTTTAAAVATVVTLLLARRRRGWLLVTAIWVLAAVIGLSRIYLGSHWPLDVLAGLALGIGSGALSFRTCRSWAQRYGSRPADAGGLQGGAVHGAGG